MSRSDEGMTPQHEEDIAHAERDAEESAQPRGGGDPDTADRVTPPGNPETDDDVVEKGQDDLDRVVGR